MNFPQCPRSYSGSTILEPGLGNRPVQVVTLLLSFAFRTTFPHRDASDGARLTERMGQFTAEGRWAWWLKHVIDGRYMRRYHQLYLRRE